MIYITGDTHGSYDISKLNTKNFPEQKNLTKKDYLIICGDFGLVWDNSKEEKYWQKWLNNKNFTTLFVDGNHENHFQLNEYEVKEWNGGKVHFVQDNVIHLMRGQVFSIDGYKIFTMGGGTSIDKQFRVEGKTWWAEEIPSKEELSEGLDNLNKHDWEVDYVISHTTSRKNMERLCYIKENSELNSYFNVLQDELKYKHWYFGHFHDNYSFEDGKHTLLYNNIIKIEDHKVENGGNYE